MAGWPRTRKRVCAVRRAPDGSAYEKCDECGVMVAIALVDMHECGGGKRREVKRFKGISGNKNDVVNLSSNFDDQPRSPFVFFMESFRKTCEEGDSIEVDRKGFEMWTNMSRKEKEPYLAQAKKVDLAYNKILNDEANSINKVDDGADSSMVGKFDKFYECYNYEDDESCSVYGSFNSYGTY